MEIKPRELLMKLLEIGVKKLEQNTHKDDPFQTDLFELLLQAEDEQREAIQAMKKFFRKPSKQNRGEAVVEITDVINQWALIGGKIMGYARLER